MTTSRVFRMRTKFCIVSLHAYTSVIFLSYGILYRVYLSSLAPHNYSLPHFFLARQRRSPTLRVIRSKILPPPRVLLPPLRLPSTVLTTRLFSCYTTFFQGYESTNFSGALIFYFQRANWKRNVFPTELLSAIDFDRNCVT